ncbi:unnamed protein product [Fraxinus pennsylvanica]|uniref:PGG domain-containing protein n=1 Tax=Fraxinus pennsylvanica TaxID=56036 RepID=A0AAD2DUH2_9LAMI|nr:unnamed protein product [Fraxinus pennsylvanica]
MDRRLIEAAQKGDVHHLLSLVKDDPFLLKAVALLGGETPLHIACMGGSPNFVKEILNLRPEFTKDLSNEGFSPLHIAAANGDLEIVKELLKIERGDCEIEQMLRLAGALGVEDMHLDQQAMQTENRTIAAQDASAHGLMRERPLKPSKKLQEYFKYDKTKDSPSKVRNTLLVVAVLIATATYQAVLSPPGSVWQDDFWPTSNTTTINDATNPPAHTAGKAVMGTKNKVSFGLFLLFNSIGFFMSVHMLYFLTINFPLQLELQVSLFALVATYDTCMGAIAPNGKLSLFFVILSIVMPFLMMILTKVVRDYPTRRRCVSQTRATA